MKEGMANSKVTFVALQLSSMRGGVGTIGGEDGAKTDNVTPVLG